MPGGTLLPDALGGELAAERVTYRQADYWITRYPGTFTPAAQAHGSGRPRVLAPRDVTALRVMARLTAAGLAAAEAARVAAAAGPAHIIEVALTPHVRIMVSAHEHIVVSAHEHIVVSAQC